MELVDEQTQTLAAGIASRDADELLHGLQEMLKVMADPEQGGRVLRQYVLASPKCVELLTAWEGGSGAPTAVPLMLLISEMLRHPMGKGEVKSIDGDDVDNNTDTKAIVILKARLDKLARTIARTKLKDIYSHLSSSQRSRQKAALKLMSSVVLRGKLIAVEVATNFDFTLEALKKLAQHPFKGPVVNATQGFLNHSARFFFIEFALSFLVVGDPGLLRWILQKRPLYAGVLHGLAKDEESTVLQVLFVIQEKVMAPASLVPTGLQSAVFGDVALEQLARIAGDELFGESANLAYKILTSLCTDPSHGLCPEVSSIWEPVNAKAGAYGGNQGRLLRLMLRLRVTEVFRHRELLLVTARLRPKLAAAYLDSVPFSLEPRPSPTWFSAMSLVAELIKISSVPPPFSLMASQGLLIPVLDGPLIRSTLRHILPRTLTKVALNRGLQHVNVLVKHACLRVLLEALLSLEILLDAAFTAANTLSSSEETGSSISEADYSSKNPGFVTGILTEERIRIGKEALRDEKESKKLGWLKLVETIQDTMRTTLPDPNILLIIYSTLNSSNSQPSDGTRKKRTQNVEVVPAGKRRKKDKGYATEEGDEKSLMNNVDEIKSDSELVEDDTSSEAQALFQVWGITAQGDTQSLLHAKVLELLAAYQRVLPVAFADKGFDPFKLLPSNPMQLSLLQQEAFLSLLLSTTGCLQKGSPKNNSTLKFVDLSGSGLMFKHVKPLLKMIVGSNVGRVRNSAYVLASRFMLSTGAFDSNAWEATMWLDHLLRLEGITSNNNREGLLDETHSDQSFLGHIGDAVVGFLAEAVGTVGRTLYKHLDQLFTLLSANSLGDGSIDVRDKSSGLVAPEFGPFVICALEHTLRVLRSDSKSLSSPQRAAISLYVASVLNHLLQIQTNTRALGVIIRSLLSPDFHSNTGVSNESDLKSGDRAWAPLQTLYWRACFLLNDGSTTLEPQLNFLTVKTSDRFGQLRKIFTACKGKEKGEDDDDNISRQRDELVSSLVCAPVNEVSKNFFLIAEVLPKICKGNFSILMSICGLHHGLLMEVDITPEDVKKAKDLVTERQLIVSNLLMRFSSTESFRVDPSSSALESEKKVSAIYDLLRSLPFSVLFSSVMNNKEGKIFTREILLCALRSAYPAIPLQDRPIVMRMVLSFIQQLQFSTHADSDKCVCLETCFTFLKKLVVPSETWSSGEEISVCNLMVGESLAHPALAGFCVCSKTRKKSVRLFDAYISDYIKSLLEACSLLELHGKSGSIAQLLGSLQESTFVLCKPHIERAMTLFLHGVNSGREPDGIKTKSKDFDSVHSIVTELAPYAGPQEFLHFISDLISCKDVQAPMGGVSLSSLCLEFCTTFFKSCPRIKFKSETSRAVTQDLVVQIFRFVVKEALRSGSEEGDLCLLSALQTPIFFGVSSFANSSQFSHLVSLTPIEVLKYCVQHPSIIRSRIARTLVEASTVHRGEFGNLLIKVEPTDSGKKLQTLNMASKFLHDQELLQEQSSDFFVLSDDDLLLLLPAVKVFLAKSYSTPATKVVISVASVYLKVLRKQFKSWDDFVDKFPILTDMSLSILDLLKGVKNTTGDFKFAGSFLWEVVKIFKHCLQIYPLTSKECVSLLRKLLPKHGLPLADLSIDILKGPESGICNFLLKVYGKVAVVKQILLNMQAQGGESDTLLVSEDGKKKSQAGDIIVRFAANLVSTLGALFKLSTEMESKPTTSFNVSGAPNVAKLLEEYLQVELVEVVDILNAIRVAEPEIVAVFQTFAKTCLRYKFGKVCGMKVLCAFALHLFTCASKIDEFSVQVRDAATCVLDLLLAHSQFVPYLFSTHTLSKSLPLNLGWHAGKGTVLSSLPSILSLIGSPVVRPLDKNSTIISEKTATSTENLKSPVVDSKDNKPADDLEGEILILVKLLQLLFQLKMHSNEELSLPSEDLVMLEDLLSMLLAAYGATTNVVDLEILGLMRQLEVCGGKGFSGLVGMDFLWGEAALKRRRARANEKAQAVDADMESEENLLEDRKRMFREDLAIDPRRSGLSVLCFPATTQMLMSNATKTVVKSKGLQGDVYDIEEQRLRMAAYDPNYILPFALHGLSEGCIDAEEFVRLGILAVTMASLSSSNEDMRKLGYEILAKYLTVLEEGPSFKGQPQIRLLLTYVKNAITEPWQQLPFVLMLFAAEASCILVHPESPHYLTITRYLLKGPSMDLEYVPLFHSMFGSGSPRYRSERLWMLRLLACGLTSYQDSRVYRRQFVLEILMSFYSSPLADTFTRKWVLQVLQKAARIRPCVQTLVERAGLLPWLALAAVNARDFIVSEQDGTETNDLEAMALEVIETVMRWRFMEQRSLGEGMEELSTVALGLHHFLTHSDTTCKQRAIFRRPTLRIMTFALRLSQRRKKYQTHFSLSLQGVLDVIQWVESEGSDSGFEIETSQETRALALQMLLQCSPPAASTHEDKQLLCQAANWAIPVAIQVLTTSKQLQTGKFQAGKGIEHRVLESPVEKLARWLAATLLLGKQADSDGSKQRYLLATSSTWWSTLMENTPSPCMGFHPLNGILANLIMELQRHIVGDGGFFSIVASLAALWPFSAPFAEDKLQVDDPRQIAKDLVDRLLSHIPAPQEANPSWRWSFNNAWCSKQISESLKTPDKLAMAASSFQKEICRVLIIVFQQLLLGDTLELHRVICQWREGLGDTSPNQQFCSKGFFERLSSLIEGLHGDTKIQ